MVSRVDEVKTAVRGRYARFAADGGLEESCCASLTSAQVGFAVDHGLYSDAQMATVPDTARRLSRGCGNPTGFAELTPGLAVVDLGCGGGIDVVLAARQIGPTGTVTGVDMTPEMIDRAREATTEAGLAERVTFLVADLVGTGLADASVDVVISNCVINLCPDKDAVYAEIFRLLRPGGRVAISDITLSEPIDPTLVAYFREGWAGCLGGAIPEAEYLRLVSDAGFSHPVIVARRTLGESELSAMSCCPGEKYATPPAAGALAAVSGMVESIKFTATKPTR